MRRDGFQKSIFITYLLLIGICIGVEIAVGILSAPVIFHPAQFLGEGVLSHFQSGILMTQIFLRFNIILMLITLFLLIYEVYMYFSKRGDVLSTLFFCVILISSLLFVMYFTPFIIDAQSQGTLATQTEEFRKMHKGSEIAIKIILISQIGLFFRRAWIGFR